MLRPPVRSLPRVGAGVLPLLRAGRPAAHRILGRTRPFPGPGGVPGGTLGRAARPGRRNVPHGRRSFLRWHRERFRSAPRFSDDRRPGLRHPASVIVLVGLPRLRGGAPPRCHRDVQLLGGSGQDDFAGLRGLSSPRGRAGAGPYRASGWSSWPPRSASSSSWRRWWEAPQVLRRLRPPTAPATGGGSGTRGASRCSPRSTPSTTGHEPCFSPTCRSSCSARARGWI